jgi:Cu+-exporting ATPase
MRDMANTKLIRDPACGMDIDVNSAAAKSDYKGQTYYFCSVGCKTKFDAAPESILGKS